MWDKIVPNKKEKMMWDSYLLENWKENTWVPHLKGMGHEEDETFKVTNGLT